jgi:hypothetical protein
MKSFKLKWLPLQVLNYSVFMFMVWYFSFSPPYRQLETDKAVVTLAFGHAGQRISECKVMSQEDLEKLAPNMRKPMDCPRERSPVTIELLLDGEPAVKDVLEAPGLYNDQSVHVYRNVKVVSGEHSLSVLMNDDANHEGPTHRLEQNIFLEPAQRLVVSFDAKKNSLLVK